MKRSQSCSRSSHRQRNNPCPVWLRLLKSRRARSDQPGHTLENSHKPFLRKVSELHLPAGERPMAPARTPARTAAKFAALALMLSSTSLFAGGPRLVAGSTYFNPGVMGTPIHWANGKLYYYVDQGPLSATVTNQQAVAMVDAAAALWNAVPTAGVSLVDKGPLNEDVNGSNILPGNNTLLQPADVSSSATKFPLGVIFDADGSVLEGVLGNDVSDPTNCENYGVTIWTDNINRDATIAHAIMILNGRCTDTDMRLSMMSFLIERAFGEILGLGFSQVFSDAIRTQNQNEMQAWPIMQPGSGGCGFTGGVCIPNPGVLHYDDIAAINRLYPITDANLAAFPGKILTAASTVSIRRSIAFRSGLGMEGVNVVAVPLDAGGDPMPQYAVTAVSGATFSGNQGNEVTGWTDQTNIPYTQWGSTDPSVQGLFDLGFNPLRHAQSHLHSLARRRRLEDHRPQRLRLRLRRLSRRHLHRAVSPSSARKRPLVRSPRPAQPIRLVRLPHPRQPHLHRRHARRRRARRPHRVQGHARPRHLGCVRPRWLRGSRFRSGPQWLGHR